MLQTEVSIVHNNASEASVFVPVEIPRRAAKNNDVAVCVKAAYHKIDHHRLVEWFEFQRLLGVTSIGVYTTPLTHPDTRKTLSQYGRTWLATRRTVDYLDIGSFGSHYEIIHLAGVNDCLYRHLYTHRFVAVFDFDEVHFCQMLTSSNIVVI